MPLHLSHYGVSISSSLVANNRIIYRHAQHKDLSEIVKLFEREKLPACDCDEHLDNFIVADLEANVIGVGGFEHYDGVAIIHSRMVGLPDVGDLAIAERRFALYSHPPREK